MGLTYAIMSCLVTTIGLQFVKVSSFIEDDISTGTTVISRCVISFGVMRLFWMFFCVWNVHELTSELEVLSKYSKNKNHDILIPYFEKISYLKALLWKFLLCNMTLQVIACVVVYFLFKLEKLYVGMPMNNLFVAFYSLMGSIYLLRCFISGLNYKLTKYRLLNGPQNTSTTKPKLYILLGHISEVIIFGLLPAVFTVYFALIVHGYLKSSTGLYQHCIKISLYFVIVVSFFMSSMLYSRVYPSLALLSMFFLLGLMVQVGILFGFYDLSTNSLSSLPSWAYYVQLSSMALAAIFALFAACYHYAPCDLIYDLEMALPKFIEFEELIFVPPNSLK